MPGPPLVLRATHFRPLTPSLETKRQSGGLGVAVAAAVTGTAGE
jgi:hypothetical protein